MKKVNFYGHVFSENGVSPDPAKIKAIQEIALPQNVKELRSFLGMVNYCGRFVRNISQLTDPLRSLLKSKEWEWKAEHTKCVK